MLSEFVLAQLRPKYAQKISEVLGLQEVTVQDLFGRAGQSSIAAARPAGGSGARVTAFVTVPEGSSTNAFAASLYTDEFRKQMVAVTEGVVGHNSAAVSRSLAVAGVSINPERFVPLEETTTRLTTTTAPTTSTTARTTVITTTTVVHMDVQTTVTTVTETATHGSSILNSFAAPKSTGGFSALVPVFTVVMRSLL